MPGNKMEKWLYIAREAALLAGSFLLKNRNIKVCSESGRDIKIAADAESELIILDYLKGKSDFSILSEESGLMTHGGHGPMWIVDPLDGSFNYMRGIPLCCVSIGLWQDDKPLVGIVYDFNRSELFSGIVRKGAWLNNKPIKVSNVTQKKKAVLCTGFPVNTELSSKNIKSFRNDILYYKKARLIGSAALSIAYVACGRTDAYKEKDIMLWDIGGALPVLLGARGKLDIKKAAKENSYHVYASNGKLN